MTLVLPDLPSPNPEQHGRLLRLEEHIGVAGKQPHRVISGDNLAVLALLDSELAGVTDAVWIDPPYNTGVGRRSYADQFRDWSAFMRPRLQAARRLLKPDDSVMVVLIGHDEMLTLGQLLHEVFPDARIQLVTVVTSRRGVHSRNAFTQVADYAFFVMIGGARPAPGYVELLEQVKVDTANRLTVRWAGLRHRGLGWRRTETPTAFYPIHVDPDTAAIRDIGDAIPLEMHRDDAPAGPAGSIPLWPFNPDGVEARWTLSVDRARSLWSQGYLRSQFRTRQAVGGISVDYLTAGQRAQIKAGTLVVIGRTEAGAVIVKQAGAKPVQSKTVWNHLSHSGDKFGTALLSSMLPGRSFDHPKSLYLVADTLRPFIGHKPDALVVDFFAGSGATGHAVMLLNHLDGGSRRSLLVTRNEVAPAAQVELMKQGLAPGHPDWEALGIAQYVCYPRMLSAVTGRTPDGLPIPGSYRFMLDRPIVGGFDENVELLSFESTDTTD